jgi:hypothetical protein
MHCRLCLLNDTAPHTTLGLWSRPQCVVQQRLSCVWYAQTHNPAETAVVVYGLKQQRGKGEGKGAEENKLPIAYDEYCRGSCRHVRVPAFEYGAEGKWWAKLHTLPFSPTHPYGRKEQRPHKETKQAGGASWLK